MLNLNEIKRYLKITWDDEDTDLSVEEIGHRAVAILSDYAGVTKEELAEMGYGDSHIKQLLLDLCRYLYNDSFEDFQTNYCGEITSLRQSFELEHFKKSQGGGENA